MPNWLTLKPKFTGMSDTDWSRPLFLSAGDMNNFAQKSATWDLKSALRGEITEWIRGAIFYPISLNRLKRLGVCNENQNEISFGPASITSGIIGPTGVTAYFPNPSGSDVLMSIGEVEVPKRYGDFRDYEPYASYEVYLPYYGYISLKAADIIGKWIRVQLAVSWVSGHGLYYITTLNSKDEQGTGRIIGTYSVNIGWSMPLGQAGANEAGRNMMMAAVRGAATIGSVMVGMPAVGAAVSTATTVVDNTLTSKEVNPATGRLKSTEQLSEHTVTTTTETKPQRDTRREHAVGTAFNTAAGAVQNFQLHPSMDRANNPQVDKFGTTNFHLIIRRVKFVDMGENFKTLYGSPVGKTDKLSNYTGLTICSQVYLEDPGLASATIGELNMIQQQLMSGVRLGLSPKTTINGVNFDLSDYATWQDVIDADAVQPFKLKDYGYALICESTEDPYVTGALTLNGVNVKSEDTIDDKGDYRTHIKVSVNCTDRLDDIPKVIKNTPIWGSTWGDLANIEDSDWIAIDDYVLNKRYMGTSNVAANSEPVELNSEWVKITDVVQGGADYTTAALTYRRFTLYTEHANIFTWAKWSDITSGTTIFSTTKLDTTGDFVKISSGGGFVAGIYDKNLIADGKFIPSSTLIRDMETTNFEVEDAFIFTVADHVSVALFGWTWADMSFFNVSGARILSIHGHPTEMGRFVMDVNWDRNGPFYYIIDPESGDYVCPSDAVRQHFYLTTEA